MKKRYIIVWIRDYWQTGLIRGHACYDCEKKDYTYMYPDGKTLTKLI